MKRLPKSESLRNPQTTELKVFIPENQEFDLGTLAQEIEALSQSDSATQHAIDFIDEHSFTEESLNDDVSYVEITTPSYERTDQFIFVNREQYLKMITAERRE